MPATAMVNPLGYAQITSLSAATGLGAVDADASTALIVVEGAPVRWRDDRTDPTASVGMLLQVGDVLKYDGPLDRPRFIQTAAGAVLNVSFYA